ncbi:MAG: nucleotide exchange factor GrpE [Chloroflexota bacterium]
MNDDLVQTVATLHAKLDAVTTLIAQRMPDTTNHSDVEEATSAPLEERLEQLTHLVQEKQTLETAHADLFNKLHRDLTYYRDDFVFANVKKPIFNDLILLSDRLDDLLEPTTLENLEREALVDRLRRFQKQVHKTLRKQDVVLIEHKPERPFDDETQEAIGTEAVATPEQNEQVISVRRKGFMYQDKLLRAEKVIVGRYVAETE